MTGRYRIHLLRAGDERALQLLAAGSGRFSEDGEGSPQQPLEPADATAFVSDPRTLTVVALDPGSSQIAGFAYACVLYRRHTKLRHLCIYEVGVDIDHRGKGVAEQLLAGLAAEARRQGITQAFAVLGSTGPDVLDAYRAIGAAEVPDPVVMAVDL